MNFSHAPVLGRNDANLKTPIFAILGDKDPLVHFKPTMGYIDSWKQNYKSNIRVRVLKNHGHAVQPAFPIFNHWINHRVKHS